MTTANAYGPVASRLPRSELHPISPTLVTELRARDPEYVNELRLELANTKALLGKLVQAVNGEWRPNHDHGRQVSRALRQLRLVRRYLLSLHSPIQPEVVA